MHLTVFGCNWAWQFETIAHAHALLHAQHTQALYGKGDAFCTYATKTADGDLDKNSCVADNRDGWSLWVHYGDNKGMIKMGEPLNTENAPQADKDAASKLIECLTGDTSQHPLRFVKSLQRSIEATA